MFSFQLQSDDQQLEFHQIPSSISFQQQAAGNHQDLVVTLQDHVTMEANITNNIPVPKARKQQGGQSPSSSKLPYYNTSATAVHQGLEDCKDNEHTQRKLVHREIEKQRRRHMAKLYASLRGLLPFEFVKGKRSTSDHMHQAVNYIKHMQENIKVLSVTRDRLKKFVEADINIPADPVSTYLIPNSVSIISSNCNGGVQILVNSCSIEDGFTLSRVLKAISDEGHNVISCTYTKANQRLIHSIQSEVNDPVSTDLTMLQQKLTAVANNC
ncbi:hypothetical protein E3N88_03601 [Mikania micrantha]|uniref:BHLH domain-containing protein n=1 Tax=Mikania micrantha TaxID=192012 RepID=A0A5N6Q707_9ASTR|nr:hypothetical protein E3N88_03601 [Mikania micrantha]